MRIKSLLHSRYHYGRALVVVAALLAPALTQAQAPVPLRLEAEAATLKGVTVKTTTPGYSGTGYVGDFENSTDSLIFTFATPMPAGQYTLAVGYTSPDGGKATTLSINGAITNLALPYSGAAFKTAAVGSYTLGAGTNRVAVAAGQGYFGIDYIELKAVPTKIVALVNGRAEAEEGLLNGVSVATTPTGFSGAGFVTGFDNSDAKNVAMSFINPTAGLYDVVIGYTSPYDFKAANLTINGERSAINFPKTIAGADFKTSNAGRFLLAVGQTDIVIGGNYGYYGIDYVQLVPATVVPPVRPPNQLADAAATPATRALFSYLLDLYGTKTLAGQQDDNYGKGGSEVVYVETTTGKAPAMMSADLYDYSSLPVAKYGKPNGTTERYIAWSKSGNGRGINSLTWHWRAPTDIVPTTNPDGNVGGAFYTKNTTFDIAAVLADKSGPKYQLLLKDIDLIAAELQKFQAADIPVLWRPLHETPGTFFWWGAKGSGPFKELWKLLYDRLTNYHKLHNLIWVYSVDKLPSAEWYPGDAYVDIAGDDVYQPYSTPNPTVNISGNWTAMHDVFAPRKMVALTESGTLANADQIRGYGTWWSWFCGWNGILIRGQPKDFLRKLYTDKDILTRDELADWRALVPTSTANSAGQAAGLMVVPNPVTGHVANVRLRLASAQAVQVELVNQLGQRVVTSQRRLVAGDNEFQLPLSGVSAGLYHLVIRQAGQPMLRQRVQVVE